MKKITFYEKRFFDKDSAPDNPEPSSFVLWIPAEKQKISAAMNDLNKKYPNNLVIKSFDIRIYGFDLNNNEMGFVETVERAGRNFPEKYDLRIFSQNIKCLDILSEELGL